MGRRGRSSPPPKPFDSAFSGLDKLEQAVIYHTATALHEWSARDVCKALWSPDVVDKLTMAFNLTRPSDRSSWNETITLSNVQCHFTLRTPAANMLCPAPGLTQFQPGLCERVVTAVNEAFEAHTKFETVRKVVRWLNEQATPGAARYYFPSLCAVMDPSHPINLATGERYQEPKRSLSEIANDMREASGTMAGALLANHDHPTLTQFTVAFTGRRDVGMAGNPDAGEEYRSNVFGLL